MSHKCEDCGYLSLGSDDHHNCLTVLQDELKEMTRQRDAGMLGHSEIEQRLGKALGYPWYKDDPKNFPDATEKDGVCVGAHVAESLAAEAASVIIKLRKENKK